MPKIGYSDLEDGGNNPIHTQVSSTNKLIIKEEPVKDNHF